MFVPLRGSTAGRRVVAILLAATVLSRCAFGDDTQSRYFEALRQRNLHSVAEGYAAAHLRQENLSAAERHELTVELVRTLMDHGELLDETPRDELWAEAERVLQAAAKTPGLANDLQLRAEAVLIPPARAAALAWRSQLTPEDVALAAQAREALRASGEGLDRLIADTALGASGAVENRPSGNLNDAQFEQARRRLLLRRAELLFQLAELESPGVNQAAALNHAEIVLSDALETRPDTDSLLAIRTLQARLSRLRLDPDEGLKSLASVSLTNAGRPARDAVLAESGRLLLAAGRLDDAVQLVADWTRQGVPLSNEFQAVMVEVLLRGERLAAERRDARLAQQIRTETDRRIQNMTGKWRQLAEVHYARFRSEEELGTELAALTRQAVLHYSQGQLELSAEKYGEAVRLATGRQLPDKAVEYALTQGSVLLQLKRWPDAAAVFRDVESAFPDHPRRAEADLLRCYAVGSAESQTGSGEEFATALRRHVAEFPRSSTCGEALWMLAEHLRQQRRWADAIAAYREIPESHERRPAALQQYLDLYGDVIAELAQTGQDASEWRQTAGREARVIGGRLLEPSTAFTLDRARTALHCASLLLKSPTDDHELTQLLLSRVQDCVQLETRRAQAAGGPLPDDWQQVDARATRLRLMLLLKQDKLVEAQQLLSALNTSPEALLSFLLSLRDASRDIDESERETFGSLMQATIGRLERRRSTLSAEQKRQLDECGVRAAVIMRNYALAASLIQGLLVDTPADRDLLHQLIDVSIKRGEVEDLRRARDAWTRLERLEPQGSLAWIEARLSTAELHWKLSERDAARKLLGVTRTLYPQLGTPDLKSRGDELWNQLK